MTRQRESRGFNSKGRSSRRGDRVRPRLALEQLEDRTMPSASRVPALLLLDPSARGALEVSGNASVQLAASTAVVNSQSPSAVETEGHGSISAGELDIVGSPGTSVSGQAKIVGLVHAGASPQSDPLAALRVPDPPAAHFNSSQFSGDIYPGTYERGIHVSGRASVTLHPGVYYLKGGLEASGQATVRGDGVTIYVSPGDDEDGLEVSGQAAVSLSPATSGAYKGVTLFQARGACGEIEVTGNGTLNLVGTVYAAGGKLEVTGNGRVNGGGDSVNLIGSQFIGSDLEAEGNGQVNLDAKYYNALTLTVSLSPAPVSLPDGTLLTNARNSTLTGKTNPQATLELETGGDTLFDEGSTTADATGSFALPVSLREGPNTLLLRVTAAGLQVIQPIAVTLDSVAPVVAVTAPAAGTQTNANVTVAGQVTDERSGVASLEAALDGGSYAAVQLASDGTFRFTTALPLDHTADGPHTEHLRAADRAGNVSFFDVSFTLDTAAPTITVSAPAPGLTTDRNVSVTGQVMDDRTGVASLQAALDGGTFAAVTLGAAGAFSLTTALPLDHSADGPHTEHLRAVDNAGNVSFFDLAFTLDTVSPTVAIAAPQNGLTTNSNITVTGQVTDDRSGVALLEGALDGGAFAPVSFDGSGNFSVTTPLALDHSADGAHTVQLRATDRAGNVSAIQDVPFTLDTVAPAVSVTAPASGLSVNHNVTITGVTADDRSGVASLQAAVDAGGYAPVSVDASGNFSLTTTLALDHSADGAHTAHLRATDRAGNLSALSDVSFTLDTVAPQVVFSLAPESDTPPLGDDQTSLAVVTLVGSTEPNTPVVLQETGAHTTADPVTGAFSFPGVALALGANPFTVQATDPAGNVGTAQHTITRDVGGTRLVEGSHFLTAFEQTFVVPSGPAKLEFRFEDLHFDTQAQFIKDAFEASLTDENGNALVLPITGSRDAFLNITEGQAPVLSPNAQLAGGTVDVDLSHIAAGTPVRLRVRLVNNDADTTTSVVVTDAKVITAAMDTPGAVTPAVSAAAARGAIDFAALSDVTTSLAASYGQTSLNEKSDVLFTSLTLQNTGSYPVGAPLVAVITHLSDPSVHVRNGDGLTTDGLPYFDLNASVAASTLAPGQSTGARTLEFFNPNGVPFTYDLVILGHLNRAPGFTTGPNTEAIPGVPYVYQAAAADADGDPLTFSLVAGPDGMAVDPTTGRVTWGPRQSDLGNQAVLLQVDDGHGGTVQQSFTVATIMAPPNRPPVFTSTPLVDASVNTAYRYQAQATDRDGDALTFALVSGPAGLTVDPSTGLVSWTPAASQLGTQAITLRVTDGHGGSADQSYQIAVGNEPGNHDPVFVSEPPTQFSLPGQSNPPVGGVDPTRVDLNLDRGDSATATVSLTVPTTGAVPEADVFLLLDDTGSFGDTGPRLIAQIPSVIAQLQAALPNVHLGFGVGRFEDYAGINFDPGFDVSFSRPFTLNQPILEMTVPGFETAIEAALNRPGPGFGNDTPEALLEGLFQTATGVGFDGNGDGNTTESGPATLAQTQVGPGDSGDVPAFASRNDPVRYHVRLLDVAQQTPLSLGTAVSGSLNPSTQSDLYTFTGTAGQRVFFDSLSVSQPAAGRWALYGPDAQLVPGSSNPMSNDFQVTLPVSGSYVLVVRRDLMFGMEGFGSIPMDYTFRVSVPPNPTTPLALNTPVQGTIAIPRQRDQYTFTVANTALTYFDAQTNDAKLTWSLEGPGGTVVSNLPFNQTDGADALANPVFRLMPGNYTLTVERTGDSTGAYQFALWNLAAATPLTPGAPVSGALAPASETDLYRFNAGAGDRFFFDQQARTGAPNASWRLVDPYGSVLFSTSFADVAALTLAQPGAYTLLIEGRLSDTAAGTYTFNVQPQGNVPPPPPLPSTLYALGSTASDSISVAGEQDRYRFTLSSDSLLYFDSLTSNSSLTWTLVGPAGTAVSNRNFIASDGGGLVNPALNLVAGAYTLTVSAVGSATGNYAFRLWDLRQASPLTPGVPVSGSLSPANETDLYQFNAAAGDRFFFDAQARSGATGATWRLLDPYGNVAFISNFGGTSSDVDVQTLSRPGRYTLLLEGGISDTDTGTYAVNVQPAPINTAPLTLGGTVSGTIATAGEQDRYTFTLPGPSLLYFDALTNNANLAWTLTGPAGAVVSGRRFTASDGPIGVNPVLNLMPGDYTLTIDPPGDAVGDYAFRLWDLRQATALTPGTPVSGDFTPASETDLYQFNAAAGDRFFFDVQARTGGPNASWRLIDPDGHVVFFSTFGGTFADVDVQTLPETGRYTLLLEGGISDTGAATYTINVQPAPLSAAPLTLGSTVSGSLATAGAQARYTFTLSSAGLLYFDSLTNNQSLNWTLTGPAGTAVRNRGFASSDDGNITNPALNLVAGDYALTVDMLGDQTGPYSFRLWNMAQATPLTPGTPVSGTLAPANATDLYRFNAAAGDRFSFAAQTASSATWRLIDPYGNVVFFTSFINVPTLTLAQPGTYTLLVEGPVGNTGTVSYAFAVQPQGNVPPPAPPPSTPYVLGSTASDSISVAGEQDRYRFTLSSASLLYFDALTDNSSLTWTLTGPAGTAVSNRFFDQSDGRNALGNPVLNLPAGDYTLTVQATGSFTGAYQFRLWDLRQATALTLGTPVSGDLAPANETDLYRFDAAAGQPFYFDVQARFGAPFAQWQLIDPYGNVVFNQAFNDTNNFGGSLDVGPVTLSVSGTYTLLLEGAITDTALGGYLFVVRPPEGVRSAVTLDQALDGVLTQPAQRDQYTFQGVAGQRFYFDGLNAGAHAVPQTGVGVRARLTSPSGVTVLDLANADDDGGPILLPETGTYTFTIDPSDVNFTRGLPASGTLGGAGFRPGALPIILAATDAGTVYQPDGITTIRGVDGVTVPLSKLTGDGGIFSRPTTPGNRGASFQPTVDALNELGALVIGLGTNTAATDAPRLDLESLAALTGAVNRSTQTLDSGISGDPIAPGDPFYFLINTSPADKGATVAGGIVSAVTSALKATAFDIDVVASDPTVSFANLTGVVPGVGPNHTATFTAKFTGDGHAHSFDLLFVRAGTGVVLGSVPVTINNDLLYPAQALDPDGDPVTYSLVSGPAGAAVDPDTGKLDWEPDSAGNYAFRLRAEDSRGGVAFQDFTVTVTSGQLNHPPAITSAAPAGATAGQPFSYRVTATDPDGDALVYYVDQAPAGMSIDRTTGVLSWTPDAGQVGTQRVSVRVLDGRGGEATQSFDLAVAAQTANRRPGFASLPPTDAAVGRVYRYEARADDPDADPLHFDRLVGPAGLTIDAATGVVVWEPAADQVGTQDVILRVSDGRGGVDLQQFRIAVAAAQTAPVLSTPAPTAPAVVGLPYRYRFSAQDAEGDSFTFRLTAAPAGMTVDPVTGILSWTPTAAQAGTNPVTLTVTDSGGLSANLPFSITVLAAAPNDPPTVGSAPRTSIRLGDVYLYQVLASDPNNDPRQYTLVTPPAGMTINADGFITWKPDPSQLGDHPVRVQVSDGRGGTAVQDFTLRVVTRDTNLPPVITSAPPGAGTVGRPYAYDLAGADPDGDPLVWTLDTAPAGMSLDATRGTLRWAPTGDQIGPAPVVVRLTDAQGAFATQAFTVLVRGVNLPPAIASTPPTQGTVGRAYFYAVRADDPEGDPLTFSLTDHPAGLTIDPATGLVSWTPAASQLGPDRVTVLAADGQGASATQTYTVVVSAAPVDQPPLITTAPVLVAAVGLAYRYDAQATDPEGEALTFALTAAPAGMTVDPATGSITWTPAASQAGSQPVTLTVTDTAGNVASQSYTLSVQATNAPPVIDSAAVRSAAAGQVYRYDVKATDPDGNALSYRLSTAPAGMAIDVLGRIRWATSAADLGTHPVTVVVTDPFGASASQSYDLTVGGDTQPPSVSLTVSTSPAEIGSRVPIFVSATDNVGVTDLVLMVNGTPLPLDITGQAVYSADHVGAFDVAARATDAAGNTATAHATLTVFDPADADPPVLALTSPADDAIITTPTEVRGTVTDTDLLFYTLSVAPVGSSQFTEIARGTASVTDGSLGTLDPTLLLNDTYVLRLQATDAAGNVATLDQEIHVRDNLKVGNFTLSFTDLTVQVSGIPITMTRTYDTLTAARSGDLGYGWRLEFHDVDVRSSVAPRTDFLASDLGFQNPFRDGTRVYVTLPGGQREGFTFQPQINRVTRLLIQFAGQEVDGEDTLAQESWQYDPVFVPDPGVTSRLTLSGATTMTRDNATGEYFGAFTSGHEPFNPADSVFDASYVLTTKDGLAYTIDASTGKLQSVTDANGNTLTFTAAGITSSTGAHVTFERDPQGRITSVTDPLGQQVKYQYDASGDLVAVTDRAGNTTQFVYRSTPAHYLDQVIDPLGRTGVRNDYDAQGRLSRLVDAAGNPVEMSYDPTHQLVTITDPLGNKTTEEYDERGNVVRHIDAVGAVTRRTFDADNNKLAETDPLGRTTTFTYDDRGDVLTRTDPLGNTTISTYQPFAISSVGAALGGLPLNFTRVTTFTDPLGNTTHNSYDSKGNLVAQTDALGNTTTTAYNSAGAPIVLTDPLGNVTRNAYDRNGNRAQRVDAAGRVTNFTSDGNGNPLSQTQADGSGWTLSYNADGMPTGVALSGLPHTAHYDGANRLTQITEPSGQTVTLAYDALGHLTQVTLPDGTIATTKTYDAVGNLVADTDSFGNVTRYAYDADRRLVQTTYPDGSTEKSTYDLAGELVEVTDALGNGTRYVYDGAGRQIQVIDALGGVTSTQYDAAGRRVAVTDPLGRTSRYQYDADGRQVATVGPDGATTRSVYDAAGRLVRTIDAAGSVTTNGYDPSGDLVSVTDALGHVTRYQYDDNNGRVAITDARGNTTRFRYDAQGHLVETTQPDGETDSSAYDSAGQLASTTDGNGQTIRYGYDVRGRLTSRTMPDGSQETYTYTSDGLVSSVTDASGTTRYDYDPVMRRLLRVTEPDGRYVRYEYDARGERTLMADSLGAGLPEDVTQYAYDALGRLVQLTDPQGGVTTYAYDADGNLTATALPNGVTETRTYDVRNRVVNIVARNAGGVTLSSFAYTLDVNGNRTREDDADGSYHVYTYDALNRVTAEAHFNVGGVSTGAETYVYDAVGNVIARSGTLLGDTTFSYNGDNQLVSGGGSTYTYDAAGHLASVTDSAGAVTRYGYDARGRLVSSQAPDGAITRYTYDSQGVRQSQQGPGGLVKYLVDAAGGPGSAQVVRESDATGATLRTYVIGRGRLSFTEGGTVRYYLTDALGSTRLLTDRTGAVTDTYRYSAYGVLLGRTGSSANPFLFAGEQQDGSSGLVYLRARYYDPATGRFLSRDAFAGYDQLPLSLNKYLYALANPVNDTDPSGNQTLLEEEITAAIQEILEAIEATEGGTQGAYVSFKILQRLGGMIAGFAVAQGLLEPERVSGYFGGYNVPAGFGIAKPLAVASEFSLVRIAGMMELETPNYYFRPVAPDPTWAAYVDPGDKDFIYLTRVFLFDEPLVPAPECPLGPSNIGDLVHEFAHLQSYGRIADHFPYAYGLVSLALLPPMALTNADNYRLAAQGLGLYMESAEEATRGQPLPFAGNY